MKRHGDVPNNNNNNKARRRRHGSDRVVLLLDLDCFYAQCECLRLGWDASTTALALLQWNSVLAVTYPARTQFGVKRGDSWQAIRQKVATATAAANANTTKQNEHLQQEAHPETTKAIPTTCHAIHVPLLTTKELSTTSTSLQEDNKPSTDHGAPSEASLHSRNSSSSPVATQTALPTLEQEYQSIFELSLEEQRACRERELGVRRLSHEGKASIERYRIASARIFQVVQEFMAGSSSSIVLERASIDEFYLDVTRAVQQQDPIPNHNSVWDAALVEAAQQETKQVGNKATSSAMRTENDAIDLDETNENEEDVAFPHEQDDRNDTNYELLLWRGAAIALAIRRHVYQALGFTLTAGIGINKTLAKLSASYGKPNGQAITLPHQIPQLLQDTPIRKCRNLGGKLGQQVLDQLESTVGAPVNKDDASFSVACIARHLSVPALRRALKSAETAQWLFDLSAYGMDAEPVLSKQQQSDHESSSSSMAATKSLTAFKSLPNSRSGVGHSIDEARPWIHLLATDLVTRVVRDSSRNGRFPKTCTLHYTKLLGNNQQGHPTVSRARASNTQTKSARVPFPSMTPPPSSSTGYASSSSSSNRIQEAVQNLSRLVAHTLRQREGSTIQLTRLGFSATDFVPQPGTKGTHSLMDQYFTAHSTTDAELLNRQKKKMAQTIASKEEEVVVISEDAVHRKNNKRALPSEGQVLQSHVQAADLNNRPCVTTVTTGVSMDTTNNEDGDLALAKKLQAQYDREDWAWHRLGNGQQRKKKRHTIDSFFSVQK